MVSVGSELCLSFVQTPARCSSWLSEFRCEVLKLVGRFKLILCFTQVKSGIGSLQCQGGDLVSCSSLCFHVHCLVEGLRSRILFRKENKPSKPALKAGLVSEASLALGMARPACVLPLCFRRVLRINLEATESCCAGPGVACAALLKDLCALLCRVPRVTRPCSCLPELWGPRLSSLLPARSAWVYFIYFFLIKAVLSHGISGPAFSQPQPATVA